MSHVIRRLPLAACTALALAACAPSATLAPERVSEPPPGTVLVVLNRTETAVWMAGVTFPSCSQSNLDQRELDQALSDVFAGEGLPPGAVDWSSLALAKPLGRPGPIFLMITADGPDVGWGSPPTVELPPCVGAALPIVG